jgi:Tfp pilus assembly protein PilW
MPVRQQRRLLPPPAAEHGTTLIELLVAMISGLVVVFALLATLEFSTHQETRVSDRVQANRIGRVAMAKIIDEVHSACTGFAATAIQAPSETPTSPLASTGNADLWFISTYGSAESGEAAPKHVFEHDIHWATTGAKSTTGQTLGTLTDYSFESTGGNGEEGWKFKALTAANATTSVVIAKNVIPPAFPATPTFFQYYKYKSATEGTLVALSTQAEITAAATANEISKVSVAFTEGPEVQDTTPSSAVAVSDSVLLRFNAAETGTEGADVPCA